MFISKSNKPIVSSTQYLEPRLSYTLSIHDIMYEQNVFLH